MTVEQLIELLLEQDKNKVVVFSDYDQDDGEEHFIIHDPDGVEVMGTDTGLEVVCIYRTSYPRKGKIIEKQ